MEIPESVAKIVHDPLNSEQITEPVMAAAGLSMLQVLGLAGIVVALIAGYMRYRTRKPYNNKSIA